MKKFNLWLEYKLMKIDPDVLPIIAALSVALIVWIVWNTDYLWIKLLGLGILGVGALKLIK